MGAPKGNKYASKFEDWVTEAEKFLDEGINAIICTDEDYLYGVNQRLPEKKRIHPNTYQKWMQKVKEADDLTDLQKKFSTLIKSKLLEQKQQLFIKLEDEPKQWQKYAWIIERKFSEWNLKKISKMDVTSKGQHVNAPNSLQELYDEE